MRILYFWPILYLPFKRLYDSRLYVVSVCTINSVGFATEIVNMVNSSHVHSQGTLLIFQAFIKLRLQQCWTHCPLVRCDCHFNRVKSGHLLWVVSISSSSKIAQNWIISSIGSGNSLVSSDNKSLHGPMLTQMCNHMGPLGHSRETRIWWIHLMLIWTFMSSVSSVVVMP